MGCCTALCLAEKGRKVWLFDQSDVPLSGASRWNEGKIHLGFLYAASRSIETARRLIPGGLRFKPIIERLIERSITPWISQDDEIYLFHRDSVVPFKVAGAYFDDVCEVIAEHPDAGNYVSEITKTSCQLLQPSELANICNPEIISSAMRVPERSVSTVQLANALADRVAQDPNITCAMSQRVVDLHLTETNTGSRWTVETALDQFGTFSAVVNALWEGRPKIDQQALGKSDSKTHHRYRVSAFITTSRKLDHSSVVIAAGPFGDVKNYNGRQFYMSWYPAGLLAQGEETTPPPIPDLSAADKKLIVARIERGLTPVLPGVSGILHNANEIQIEGGWVYAQGEGRLENPASSLHGRSLIGLNQTGTYFSVDTGKYSVAPLLAESLAAML